MELLPRTAAAIDDRRVRLLRKLHPIEAVANGAEA